MPPDTVPCPGCGLPMGLDEEVCPHCRRPRDEREIELGKQALLDEEARLKRQPRLIALRLAAIVVFGGLFFSRHVFYRAAASLMRRGSAEIDQYSDPDFVAGRAPRAPEPVPPPAAEPAAPTLADAPRPPSPRMVFVAPHRADPPSPPVAAPAAKPVLKPAAPKKPAPRRKAVPSPVPPPPGSTDWLFYGVVFDMSTGAPVPHAKIVVRHEGQQTGMTTVSDENGFYRISTPRYTAGNSYVVDATAPGYREGQLEDRDPSWLEATDEARLSAMSEVAGHDLDPVPRKPADADGLVNVDLLLLPAAKNGPAR